MKTLFIAPLRIGWKSRSHRPCRGFTLIELVTVIAVIVSLATLIMPAFSEAKGRAQGVLCSNNLRQLGLSWLMYADDYNNQIPPNGEEGGSEKTWVQGWLDLKNSPDNTNTMFLTTS